MRPRIVFRTHYQVDEPALVEFLVKKATSPVQSTYTESAAKRLADEVKRRGTLFNIAAGAYAVDLGRALGVLTEQNTWTDKGHLVNLVAGVGEAAFETECTLDAAERLLHLRLFLEGDGAALLYLAKVLVQERELPGAQQDWNEIAQALFAEVFQQYLHLSVSTEDRTALRAEIDRLRQRRYGGKSGAHKLFVHLQTLYRLGLVERAPTASTRAYRLTSAPDAGLAMLSARIPNVYELERVVAERGLVEHAADVLGLEYSPCRGVESYVLNALTDIYRRIMQTGVAICPLSTLIEGLQIQLLAQQRCLLRHSTAVALLERIQRENASDVRFHVDRHGHPAFIKLADHFLRSVVRS